jgi:hypothetical protein
MVLQLNGNKQPTAAQEWHQPIVIKRYSRAKCSAMVALRNEPNLNLCDGASGGRPRTPNVSTKTH